MSDNALSFSPTKWSIIGAAFSNGNENQEKNQDCGNRPICCGCHKHHRENSEWVVFSDKTWWHAFCAAEELFRQLAQRDERNAALASRVEELEGELARPKHAVLRELANTIERYEWQGERAKELKADFVAVAPVVRAAMDQEDRHSDAARHYPHDPRDLCACGVCVKVRDLTADVRERLMALERMGVDRGN